MIRTTNIRLLFCFVVLSCFVFFDSYGWTYCPCDNSLVGDNIVNIHNDDNLIYESKPEYTTKPKKKYKGKYKPEEFVNDEWLKIKKDVVLGLAEEVSAQCFKINDVYVKINDSKLKYADNRSDDPLQLGKRKYALFSINFIIENYKREQGKLIYNATDDVLLFCSDIDSVERGQGYDFDGIFTWLQDILNISTLAADTANSSIFARMFCCWNLNCINLEKINTSNITNMRGMFYGCSHLTELNLSSFDTKNVVDMHDMFYNCHKLTELNLSSFNTQNVQDMSCMFYRCRELKELNLSSFNTQNVTAMSCMFYGCSGLEELNLSSFNTQNVTIMNCMFERCSVLEELNLSSFSTKNVISMSSMFCDCRELKKLNLSSFDMQNVENMIDMFKKCHALSKVKCNKINFKKFKEVLDLSQLEI